MKQQMFCFKGCWGGWDAHPRTKKSGANKMVAHKSQEEV